MTNSTEKLEILPSKEGSAPEEVDKLLGQLAVGLAKDGTPEISEVHNSSDTFDRIREWLAEYSGPSMDIIHLAQQYIDQLRAEVLLSPDERAEKFPKSVKRGLYNQFGGCVGCGEGVIAATSRNDKILQPHHITPREFGGDSSPDNAMIVCRDCHVIIHSSSSSSHQ